MRRSKIAEPSRLARLEIEDFGLIERASLEFAAGFTACSGETGSGKTMLLGALAFVLGERSSSDIVRSGTARARVTLEIDADAELRARLEAEGFEAAEGEAAILWREMLATGKSSARINGRLATGGQLRAVGETLVEQIGQHEQQRLLSSAYQLDLLDAFAGDAALARRAAVSAAYERARSLEDEVAARSADAGRMLAEFEFCRFAAAEIAAAAPEPGEDAALRERRDYLANVERIASALASAHGALAESEGSALESLGAAASAVAAVARFSPALDAIASALAALQSDANDVAIALAREREATEFDGAELESATARLDALERLKKKYGGTLEAVLASRERFEAAVAAEATRDEREAELRAALEAARVTLAAEASELGALRAAAARELEIRVAGELAALAMPAARFEVVLEPLASVGPNGAERALFALSPNPGEPVRAIARAASGGELARVLLALVAVLADRRERTALVFDEIDAGIGGATATSVGVRLGALASATQVLCVTHLAQIAAWADRHYVLRKRTRGAATVVELVSLADGRPVLEEIARMLSGSTAGVALDHADALVRDVRATKARAAKRPARAAAGGA
jgi:DNA repair protein RecN (Recombination protein N)